MIKRSSKSNKINQICLAYKKRGFGEGKWNGAGGKVESDETVETAMKREVLEELGVIVKDYEKVAENTFRFIKRKDWNQLVSVYICSGWEGEPTETEEMRPFWLNESELDYADLWVSDRYWLPDVLEDRKLKAEFIFDGTSRIKKIAIELDVEFKG